MNSNRAVVLFGCFLLNLSACAFKDVAADAYHCSADKPGCPEGLICANGLCVPDGTDDSGTPRDTGLTDATHDGRDATSDTGPPCIADQERECDSEEPGICSAGNQTCVFQLGAWRWTKCEPNIQPGAQAEAKGTDSCGNALDDDCDGKVDLADEDCQDCSDGQVLACDTGEPGECRDGQKSCTSHNTWPLDCTPLKSAAIENCTGGLDEDCDGLTDAADPFCLNCGDGTKNPLEECDGEDFGGKSCKSSGFDQGTLVCRPSDDAAPCAIDYSGCLTCIAPTPPDGVHPDRIVDATLGNDAVAVGACIPYRTINAALTDLSSGSVVWVAPGTYSKATTSDTFPITVPQGVRLIGNSTSQGSGTIIRGDGSAGSGWYAVVRLSADSTIQGFHLYSERTSGSVAAIHSAARPTRIANNRFSARTAGIYFRGGSGTPATEITGNRFFGASYGIQLYGSSVTASAQPRIRDNYFNEQSGAAIYSSNYSTTPNLGLDMISDPGGNTFSGGSGARAVRHSAPTLVYAYGNTWPRTPPRCGYEILVYQGKVTWGTGAGEACEP